MMDAAVTVEPVSVGAGTCGVLGGGGDGDVAESGNVDGGAVQAVGDAVWSGDSGSLGGVGVSGEARPVPSLAMKAELMEARQTMSGAWTVAGLWAA